MPRTTVIIASSSPIQRARLARIAAAAPELDVIATTSDLPETFTQAEAREPDVVIMSEEFCRAKEWSAMKSLFYALGSGWIVASSNEGAPEGSWAGKLADEIYVSQSMTPAELVVAVHKCQELCRWRVMRPMKAQRSESERRNDPLVVIGASTGGVDALLTLLSAFPGDCPPTMIVQHTGRGFSDSLIRLLDKRCDPTIVAAADGLALTQGQVCVAAGTEGHLVLKPGSTNLCQIRQGEPISGHTPSVDALFHSVLPLAPRVIGVILTGMGRDGAAGLLGLRHAGCLTIGQDEASSVVYGMPKAAFNLGAVQRQLPIQLIAAEIIKLCRSVRVRASDSPARTAEQ